MSYELTLVGDRIGCRYYDQPFTLVEKNGVKQLKYPLLPFNTFFDNDQDLRSIVAITVIDPTGKGSDITGTTFASAATVNKGFCYLKGTDQRDIWPMMPLADLIPSDNKSFIFLDSAMLGNINWNQSYLQWGVPGDIADDDIGNNFWLHVAYATIPQGVALTTAQLQQQLIDALNNVIGVLAPLSSLVPVSK